MVCDCCLYLRDGVGWCSGNHFAQVDYTAEHDEGDGASDPDERRVAEDVPNARPDDGGLSRLLRLGGLLCRLAIREIRHRGESGGRDRLRQRWGTAPGA